MAKVPPNILTPKDRLYIEDLMNVSMVYYKKCRHYVTMTKDTDSRRRLEEFSKKLALHYDELLKIFETKATMPKGGITRGKK